MKIYKYKAKAYAVLVKAGKYIYIVFCSSVAGKTNSASNPTNYKVRLQYRNIYD